MEGTTNRAAFVNESVRGTKNIVVFIHEEKMRMTNQKGFVDKACERNNR
jgi:hypothetical protein